VDSESSAMSAQINEAAVGKSIAETRLEPETKTVIIAKPSKSSHPIQNYTRERSSASILL
jgi:hypothetical protein